MTAKSFVLGVITGLLIAILFIALVVDRYRVTTGGPEGIYIIKSDRWTGRTWVSQFLASQLLWDEVADPIIAPTEVPPSLIPPSGIVPPEDLPPSTINPQQK